MSFSRYGNILKFDLVAFPAFTAPEGRRVLGIGQSGVPREIWDRTALGDREDRTRAQAPQTVLEILGATGFPASQRLRLGGSMETKIVQYADMRVGPFGILPFKERLDDLSRRYAAKKGRLYEEAERGCYDIRPADICRCRHHTRRHYGCSRRAAHRRIVGVRARVIVSLVLPSEAYATDGRGRNSSVVERHLGKMEAESPILSSGST